MSTEIELQPFIDTIYAAASGETEWNACLSQVASALDGPVLLRMTGSGCRFIGMVAGGGLADEHLSAYRDRYAAADPLAETLALARPGDVRGWTSSPRGADIEASEFYRNWMLPQEFEPRAALACLVDCGAEPGNVTLFVHARSPNPTNANRVEFLQDLLPHLRRSLRLWARLRRAEFVDDITRHTMHRWPLGVITLDADGAPVAATASACAAISACPLIGTRSVCPSVCAADCQKMIDFVRAVGQAPGSGRLLGSGDADPRDFDWLTIDNERGQGGMILVFPRGSRPKASTRELRQYYGFSEREAEVAAALVEGKSAEEIAAADNVSVATVRTQIRSLLEKTGTTRQTSLVVTLLTGPAAILFGV